MEGLGAGEEPAKVVSVDTGRAVWTQCDQCGHGAISVWTRGRQCGHRVASVDTGWSEWTWSSQGEGQI